MLYKASSNGEEELVRQLLESAADTETKFKGQTALHEAAMK